jgi:hypothetical protein
LERRRGMVGRYGILMCEGKHALPVDIKSLPVDTVINERSLALLRRTWVGSGPSASLIRGWRGLSPPPSIYRPCFEIHDLVCQSGG